MSVLVADIENRTGDSTFDGAIEQSLSGGLETGGLRDGVSPPLGARTLARKLKPGSRIDAEMARLISNSEGIGVIVSGSVERQGNGYQVSVTSHQCGRRKSRRRGAGAGVGQVEGPRCRRLARRRRPPGAGRHRCRRGPLRPRRRSPPRRSRRCGAFAHGQELQQAGRFEEALREYQRAIDLDPGFARAYSGMAGVYANYFRQPDKAAASYEAAMKHLDRMTEREKYRTLGTYYLDIVAQLREGDRELRARSSDSIPADDSGHGNLALRLHERRPRSRMR